MATTAAAAAAAAALRSRATFSSHDDRSVEWMQWYVISWLGLTHSPQLSICFCVVILCFSSFQEWANAMSRRSSSVRPSSCLSVNLCANRFFSQTHGRIATKRAQDGLQVSMHPGCAQGQGQRSRDTRTFLHSWNDRATPSLKVWLCTLFNNLKHLHEHLHYSNFPLLVYFSVCIIFSFICRVLFI